MPLVAAAERLNDEGRRYEYRGELFLKVAAARQPLTLPSVVLGSHQDCVRTDDPIVRQGHVDFEAERSLPRPEAGLHLIDQSQYPPVRVEVGRGHEGQDSFHNLEATLLPGICDL